MDSYQKFEDAIVEHWGGAGHLERASALLVRCRRATSGNTPVGEASHGGGAGWEQRPIRQFG